MDTIDNRGTSTPLPQAELQLATATNLFTQFRAQRILPGFPVRVSIASIPVDVIDRRIYSTKRAPDGTITSILTEVNATKYNCEEAALKTLLPDSAVKVYGDRAKAEFKKARQVALSLLLARENNAAALVFSTTTFDAAHRVDILDADRWTAAPGNPVKDLQAGCAKVQLRTGLERNQLSIFMSSSLHDVLSANDKIINQVKALPAWANLGADGIPATIPASALAALVGVKEVVLLGGTKDTSNRAKASSFVEIWDKTKVLVAYVDTDANADLALGHTFVSDEGMELSDLAQVAEMETNAELVFKVDRYRNEDAIGDTIRVRDQIDMKVTNVDAGCLLTNCQAP